MNVLNEVPPTQIGLAINESRSLIIKMLDYDEMPTEAIGTMIETYRYLKSTAVRIRRARAERDEKDANTVTDAKLQRRLNGAEGLEGGAK
ncbi:hypothetical protein FACS189487_05670 [Campylobacterota bacterium]|nr:hypothetical protein FACS189487_05670 [Campylobacterota bacterium]